MRPQVSPEEGYRTGQSAQLGIRIRWNHAGRGLSKWEIEAADKVFQFRGTAIGENPTRRLSFIDTELEEQIQGWSEIERREGLEPGSIRRLAEERLLSSPSYGQDHIQVEKPQVPVPYAKYLDHRKVQGRRTVEHAAADIVNAITAVGIEAAAVVQYEQDNEDQYSAAIIAAVEALNTPDPEPILAA